MKKKKFILGSTVIALSLLLMSAAEPKAANQETQQSGKPAASKAQKPLRIGIVNFKRCIENSKIGKQEVTNFEGLKKQMESVLTEKEKAINEMGEKFSDPDYLDSISPEKETELKRKFRQQSQEIGQLQNQYMQTLQQTNLKVISKLNELVNKAANKLAKAENLDIVLNEEGAFYYSPDLDFSSKVIAMLDDDFAKQEKDDDKVNAQP